MVCVSPPLLYRRKDQFNIWEIAMIDIDQFFVDVFGGFAVHARMIMTFWIILGGLYWLVRIPRNKRRTAQHYQDSTKTLLLFVGLVALITIFIVMSYLFSR